MTVLISRTTLIDSLFLRDVVMTDFASFAKTAKESKDWSPTVPAF